MSAPTSYKRSEHTPFSIFLNHKYKTGLVNIFLKAFNNYIIHYYVIFERLKRKYVLTFSRYNQLKQIFYGPKEILNFKCTSLKLQSFVTILYISPIRPEK